ncbi:hypothetical protein HZS_1133 [Henneguya salminicola]|nr:hypothetical protein HZS_1133 [Henneguya salminicola]
MKALLNSQIVKIPKKGSVLKYILLVSVLVEGRKVEVKGPRGLIKQDFSHMQISIKKLGRKSIEVSVWFGKRRDIECLNTTCSLINNMVRGVTEGFRYKLRLVYAHYPIQLSVDSVKKEISVKNFIGQRHIRNVKFPEGVKIYPSGLKDEIIVEGIDLRDVSLTSARLHQCARPRDKDIRKLLDGIYITDRTTMESVVASRFSQKN